MIRLAHAVLSRAAMGRLWLCAVLPLVVACGGSESGSGAGAGGASTGGVGGAAGAPSGGAAGTGALGGAGGAGGTTLPACSGDLATALQNVADQDRGTTPALFLGVSTPTCSFAGVSREDGSSVTPDTRFRVGSITKTFTSAVILLLEEDGKLDIEDPLGKYLPEFDAIKDITLHQALNHTGGIYNYTEDPSFAQQFIGDPSKLWQPAELVQVALAHSPYFAPGTSWHYSNTDYVLLGMVIETVENQPAAAVIRSRLLEPLGLDSTYMDGSEPGSGQLAPGFSQGQDVTAAYSPTIAWTAGAIASTSADLTRWATALYGGQVLSDASMKELLDGVDTGTGGVKYGLGVLIVPPANAYDDAYGHDGAIPGYNSEMLYWPNEHVAVATNVTDSGADANAPLADAVDVLRPVYFP
jgi:D-alanyl-D-alanine carboxypeptidase